MRPLQLFTVLRYSVFPCTAFESSSFVDQTPPIEFSSRCAVPLTIGSASNSYLARFGRGDPIRLNQKVNPERKQHTASTDDQIITACKMHQFTAKSCMSRGILRQTPIQINLMTRLVSGECS